MCLYCGAPEGDDPVRERVLVLPGAGVVAREAEVRQLHAAVAADEHVAALDVPVEDVAPVAELEGCKGRAGKL